MSNERQRGSAESTAFRMDTAWGTAWIHATDSNVTRLCPPVAGGTDRGCDGPDADGPGAPPDVRELAVALCAYLDGAEVELAPRARVRKWLDAAGIRGFRRDVSLALFDVPRGMTLSYGELAALAGRPGAARAVGTACARNPIPIVVPCHRVVHAGARPGAVGTYGAATGSEYKRRLLELEHARLVAPA